MFMSSLAGGEAPSLAPSATLPASQWVETPLPGGGHELKLWGKFPPRWLANLTAGLAGQGIGISRGYANKLSPTVWQGTFEIHRSRVATAIDFAALAQAETTPVAVAEIRLDSFSIKPMDEALFVEVQGPDSVGFLMTLLKTFAFCSLYPIEVSIDTPAGRVHDRFWLKGIGGSTPSTALAEGLAIALGKLRAQ